MIKSRNKKQILSRLTNNPDCRTRGVGERPKSRAIISRKIPGTKKWLEWIKKCNQKLRLSAISKSYARDVDDDDVQGRSKKNKVKHGKKDYELKFL
jgi:hypothetical protein